MQRKREGCWADKVYSHIKRGSLPWKQFHGSEPFIGQEMEMYLLLMKPRWPSKVMK